MTSASTSRDMAAIFGDTPPAPRNPSVQVYHRPADALYRIACCTRCGSAAGSINARRCQISDCGLVSHRHDDRDASSQKVKP